MVKNTPLLLLLLTGCFYSICSGQDLDFYGVERMPASVNSVAEESLPLLAPDGALFFTRSLYAGNYGGKFSGTDVWSARGTGRGWANATNVFPYKLNTSGQEALIGIGADGNTRYFVSTPLNNKMRGIYVSTRTGDRWSTPTFVPIPGIGNEQSIGLYVSADFDVILLSMKAPDSRGEEDLYFSVKDASGRWTVPKNMGATLNTTGFEISPFLSADKKRLYFASNGHEGEGDADIFCSNRLYNSWETWSTPVNLGKQVNSPRFDAYFSIYGDSIAYFASNRDGGLADLYQVKATRRQTVLTGGQRYLSVDEWERTLGGKVRNELAFSSGQAALNASQRELLFFIANKLQLQRDILIHLVVLEQEDAELSSRRLDAVAQAFADAGIGRERIIVRQVNPVEPGAGGRIAIRLIE